MRIEYRIGNALDGPEDAFVHGCNAKGVMASGIAAEVRRRFPAAYDSYRTQYNGWILISGRPMDLLGTVSAARVPGKIIFNAVTQDDYGRDPTRVYVLYAAVEKAFRHINDLAPGRFYGLAMPRIGCGLANGDWDVVSEIIERTSTHYRPVVYDLP